ncbi:hypothetical protein YPPY66_4248 [Yersinia pestis PY-66]|uniref:Uncharacterized protein n=2 Tax=Yersinia pestis TaxID=632 RepID=A0AAV3BJV8_YERPE|nr:hypothetical protein YPIP275_4075 [Yersinia pestis biovar Orientalis str. IP275]EDR39533.1 hypothetical protein YpF1991016_2480 [Yersinia pestis biovar Orientalis str. F1991016]EDR48990.1 hypothetical protein YpB42003004_0161 [Yersinia pestis biovar Antiqua str. B42003004]EDR57566.1 hypothetical protein YpMG051020_4289 [Yersinia pestis biovar Orientalis str. MG05-1020]EFA48473.1 hypothetical protein YPD27_2755 [Yersinia pestis KIM D27]EIQ85048.1 hypothetical protein YPPY01_3866 [Yersinia pe
MVVVMLYKPKGNILVIICNTIEWCQGAMVKSRGHDSE